MINRGRATPGRRYAYAYVHERCRGHPAVVAPPAAPPASAVGEVAVSVAPQPLSSTSADAPARVSRRRGRVEVLTSA